MRELIAGIRDFALEGFFDFEIGCGFKFLHMAGQVSSCQAKSLEQEIKIRLLRNAFPFLSLVQEAVYGYSGGP